LLPLEAGNTNENISPQNITTNHHHLPALTIYIIFFSKDFISLPYGNINSPAARGICLETFLIAVAMAAGVAVVTAVAAVAMANPQ
jgi:hypothetical protein